ncbi:Uncharacterised protein [Brevundimonas vancanneytii]|uniref:Peptidase M28 domain-containing protein n=1 Tax=Brevundimonas vancanneytii TaxID=1325724 RepID=A0A4P1K0E1_9CAUL|nr:Uncharacterised protein [Brevundimonas vancanneytii]
MAYLSSTGEFVDAPIEPRLARAADYRANRYHQAADEWEADWDYSGMLQDLDVMFKVGQDLANKPHLAGMEVRLGVRPGTRQERRSAPLIRPFGRT